MMLHSDAGHRSSSENLGLRGLPSGPILRPLAARHEQRRMLSRHRASSSSDSENQPHLANETYEQTPNHNQICNHTQNQNQVLAPKPALASKRPRSLSLPNEWDRQAMLTANVMTSSSNNNHSYGNSATGARAMPHLAPAAAADGEFIAPIALAAQRQLQMHQHLHQSQSLHQSLHQHLHQHFQNAHQHQHQQLPARPLSAFPATVAAMPLSPTPTNDEDCCTTTSRSFSSEPMEPSPHAESCGGHHHHMGSKYASTPASGSNNDSHSHEPQPCIICYGGFSAKRPPVLIPCAGKCNDAPVHAKCIFEWKETKRPFTLSPSSCPLCRGPLTEMDYTPPDPLRSESLVRFSARKSFVSRPVPRTAGMVRCYIRAVREDSVIFGKSTRYEMYLQAPPKVRYPHGELPGSSSPVVGDVLLMVARKRTLKQGACFHSVVDISLDQTGRDFDRKGSNFVGCVKSSFSGLEHTILAPFNTQPRDSDGLGIRRHRHRNGGYLELGSVRYTQNRVGRSVGPRRMQVCVPQVGECSTMDEDPAEIAAIEAEKAAAAAALFADSDFFSRTDVLHEEDDEEEDDEEHPWSTNVYRPVKTAETMRQLLRKGQPMVDHTDELLYGTNKQPYWLDSIQAYSLDFAGRVTLPSNKNFQLCLEGLATPGVTVPEVDSTNEITLQFGKVHEGPVEVYTLDLQWPLSPVQAFGICLTASIQKVCCA